MIGEAVGKHKDKLVLGRKLARMVRREDGRYETSTKIKERHEKQGQLRGEEVGRKSNKGDRRGW